VQFNILKIKIGLKDKQKAIATGLGDKIKGRKKDTDYRITSTLLSLKLAFPPAKFPQGFVVLQLHAIHGIAAFVHPWTLIAIRPVLLTPPPCPAKIFLGG